MAETIYAQIDYQFDESVGSLFALLVDTATEELADACGLAAVEIMPTGPYQLRIRMRCDSPLALLKAGGHFRTVTQAIDQVHRDTAHMPLGPLGSTRGGRGHRHQLSIYNAQGVRTELAA